MKNKHAKEKINIIDFLNNVPIYPKKVMPTFLGMRNCNLPADTLLVEDDEGFIFFMKEEDKTKSIENLMRANDTVKDQK